MLVHICSTRHRPCSSLAHRYSSPNPKVMLNKGRLGTLRVSYYVATMNEDLHVTYPEHNGYRTGKKGAVAAVSYGPKTKAAIRKQVCLACPSMFIVVPPPHSCTPTSSLLVVCGRCSAISACSPRTPATRWTLP